MKKLDIVFCLNCTTATIWLFVALSHMLSGNRFAASLNIFSSVIFYFLSYLRWNKIQQDYKLQVEKEKNMAKLVAMQKPKEKVFNFFTKN